MELRDKDGLTEKEYLESFTASNYPKPSLTADIAVFGKKGGVLYLLLIKRGGHPYLGKWALPGGFSDPNEPSEMTAARELEEETTLSGLMLEPVGFYSTPGRDPRGWTVSMAYASVIDLDKYTPKAADDAAEAGWFKVDFSENEFSLENETAKIVYKVSEDPAPAVTNISKKACIFTLLTDDGLAFDHYQIVYDAIKTISKNASC